MDDLQATLAKLTAYSHGNSSHFVRSRPRTVREQTADNVCSSVRFLGVWTDGRSLLADVSGLLFNQRLYEKDQYEI